MVHAVAAAAVAFDRNLSMMTLLLLTSLDQTAVDVTTFNSRFPLSPLAILWRHLSRDVLRDDDVEYLYNESN